jgi:hypothetical protein
MTRHIACTGHAIYLRCSDLIGTLRPIETFDPTLVEALKGHNLRQVDCYALSGLGLIDRFTLQFTHISPTVPVMVHCA